MIRVLFLLVVIAVVLQSLFGRRSARIRAGRRIGLVLVAGLFLSAALAPGFVDDVAKYLGVGRGADLVLYLLSCAFLYLVVATYQKFKEQERRLAELARQVALQNAMSEPWL